jgi:hypothetical protein
MSLSSNRRNQAISLQQAAQDSPTLLRLSELGRDSVARLESIQPIIPAALRGALTAGPIDGTSWCLLLDNNATAAKIRQLVPTLLAHLQGKGWPVDSIRLKVRNASSR